MSLCWCPLILLLHHNSRVIKNDYKMQWESFTNGTYTGEISPKLFGELLKEFTIMLQKKKRCKEVWKEKKNKQCCYWSANCKDPCETSSWTKGTACSTLCRAQRALERLTLTLYNPVQHLTLWLRGTHSSSTHTHAIGFPGVWSDE